MNKRLAVILLSAFMIASACSYLVYRVVAARITASAPRSTTKVVVAATDIPLGTILRDVDLTSTEIIGPLPKGAIVNPKDAVGRGVIASLSQNEPILDNHLAPAGSGGGLAATIKPGMRAVAVRVDEVVSVAGFVTPGMRVDLLISGNPPGDPNPTEGTKVKTLLQNLEVLSAGQDIQKDADGKAKPVPVVNLLVTPEQAEQISLASSQTHIQLVLRNPLDTEVAQTPGTAVGSLFTGSNTPPKPHVVSATPHQASAPASKVYLVQVFNGSKRTDEKFVNNNEEK
jgi:pilus assembly protein CpaB